jgi:hypothetical protein
MMNSTTSIQMHSGEDREMSAGRAIGETIAANAGHRKCRQWIALAALHSAKQIPAALPRA